MSHKGLGIFRGRVESRVGDYENFLRYGGGCMNSFVLQKEAVYEK